MDVPVITAVIGVSGTLLGAIVVGCLTPFTNFLVQKRREQAEFKIGCRLIATDLYENEVRIETMIEAKRWWSPQLAPEMKSWEEHQKVFAAYLSEEAWLHLRNGIMAVHLAHHFLVTANEAGTKTIDDRDIRLLTIYRTNIHTAQTNLQPYLGESLTGSSTPPQAGHPRTIRAWMTR